MENLDPAFAQRVRNPAFFLALQNLVDASVRIVNDFDTYGGTLQPDENGLYNEMTNIEMLRGSIIRFDCDLIRAGDYYPHLSESQHHRIRAVAVEVLMAADGDEKPNLAAVEDDVSLMTPHERLVKIGFFDRSPAEITRLVVRLGFDPRTGK